jgi:nucleoid-associated protein YgaU
MDLFGFVKDVGRRLFNKDEEAAEKIKKHILANNPGVEDLEVTFDRGIVGLKGRCTRPDAFQKCILMAGNVQGVADVYASGLKAFVAPKPTEVPVGGPGQHAQVTPVQPKEEYYVIVKGDSLSKIAKRYYGNANKWPQLFEANREVIQDPDKIFPGQKIRVPLD